MTPIEQLETIRKQRYAEAVQIEGLFDVCIIDALFPRAWKASAYRANAGQAYLYNV